MKMYQIIPVIMSFIVMASSVSAQVKYQSTGCTSFGSGLIFAFVTWILCNIVTVFIIVFFVGGAVGIYEYLKSRGGNNIYG